MKKFYAESPILTVSVFENTDVLTISYGDDNMGGWAGSWFGATGGANNG